MKARLEVTKLERKLSAALRKLGAGNGQPLVVAISGGADSVSLLDALWRLTGRGKLSVQIFAAHLNHKLRGEESDEDEAFVSRLAAEHGVECLVERIPIAEIASANKGNLEATARQLRYEFLTGAALARGANLVCTAHTMDDQAETVLMRLLRGSGAEGLRGILPVRQLSQTIRLIRPLLTVSRTEVLAHCENYNLDYRQDSSNLSLDLTRNRIRQELLPLLQSFNPRANQALCRTAELLANDEDFLHQSAVEVLEKVLVGGGLNVKLLAVEPAAIRRRVLRLWLRANRGGLQRIEAVHIAALERLILRGQGGKIIELPGGFRVLRRKGILEIIQIGTAADGVSVTTEEIGTA